MEYIETIKKRRSYYSIKNSSLITEQKILEVIESALKYTPSAFNGQSQMVAVLFGEDNQKLWQITLSELKKIVPTENFAKTEEKIKSFAKSKGTILFFNDDNITYGLQKNFPLYKDNFPVWAEQASGMLQINCWNMLESEGLGANLQHYNPLIDVQVKDTFNIAKSWRLIAQMPFGDIAAMPDDKQFTDINNRIKIIGGGETDTKNQVDEPDIACSPEFNGCISGKMD